MLAPEVDHLSCQPNPFTSVMVMKRHADRLVGTVKVTL